MQVHQIAARLRAFLGEEGDFATVLRGAGLVVIIRVLASAVGFASVILLARWMGSSEYGLYSFAIACMVLLAYPATLGLPGAAVRFVAQYAAANDWQHVVGFMKVSSWLAFGCGALIATVAIGAVLAFKILSRSGLCRANDRRACRHSNRRFDDRQVRSDSRSWVAGTCVGASSAWTTPAAAHCDSHHPGHRHAFDRHHGGWRLDRLICRESHCAMGTFARAPRHKEKRRAQDPARPVARSRRVLLVDLAGQCDPSSGRRHCSRNFSEAPRRSRL